MSPRRALVVTAALAALSFAPLAAQVPLSEYAARRAALAATVDSGVVLAFGAVEPVNFWPTFQQHASFLYLTGFEEPDAVYVMVKRGGQTTATLYAAIAVALSVPAWALYEWDTSRYKTCPDCLESVNRDARVCRHCGFRFEPAATPTRPESGIDQI